MFYGFREGVELDPNDPDTRLLPELVDRVIVTKVKCKSLNVIEYHFHRVAASPQHWYRRCGTLFPPGKHVD